MKFYNNVFVNRKTWDSKEKTLLFLIVLWPYSATNSCLFNSNLSKNLVDSEILVFHNTRILISFSSLVSLAFIFIPGQNISKKQTQE